MSQALICLACCVDVILVLMLLSDQQSSKTMFTINNADIYDGVCLLCENVVAMRLFISLSLFAEVKGANDLSVVMSYYPEIPGLPLRSPQQSHNPQRKRERFMSHFLRR